MHPHACTNSSPHTATFPHRQLRILVLQISSTSHPTSLLPYAHMREHANAHLHAFTDACTRVNTCPAHACRPHAGGRPRVLVEHFTPDRPAGRGGGLAAVPSSFAVLRRRVCSLCGVPRALPGR
eukprot:357914-Chlamydomonas_euryale.AAC.4